MSAIAERKKTSSKIKENKVVFKVAKKTSKQEDQELSFETLLKEIPKKLMGYAMVLVKNNKDDAWDLIQTTVLKLIEKKKVFMKVKYKTSFTKVILRNAFIDKYRKDKSMLAQRARASCSRILPRKLQAEAEIGTNNEESCSCKLLAQAARASTSRDLIALKLAQPARASCWRKLAALTR